MNAVQCYIIDSFIKSAKHGEQKLSGSGEGEGQGPSYDDSDVSEDELSFTPGDVEESLSKDTGEETTGMLGPGGRHQKPEKNSGQEEETAFLQPSDRDLKTAASGLR